MHASETKLQSLIEGTKQYVVPLFQRAYSWKKEQWEILWEDIMSLYDDEEDGRNHFIGSIVTMPTNSVPEGVQKYLLIDGQQRLTTFFILLAVLRDFVGSDNNAYADEIQETMLVNRFKKDNDFYKLMPTQLDRHTFKLILDKSDLGEDKNNIKECYDFFISQLKDPRQKSVDLERIKRIVTSQSGDFTLTRVPVFIQIRGLRLAVIEHRHRLVRVSTTSDEIQSFAMTR
jgi:uncharacterized protein with ParB-like and HNH nuclease domain